MKTFTLLFAATFALCSAKAQYSNDFESGEAALTGNCWTLTDVHYTNTGSEVITGAGSLYTNPPTGATTRDLITPTLNATSTSLTVSFNYKVSSKINGIATRTIEVGYINAAGVYTSFYTIIMDKNTPTSVQTFNQTFTLAATGPIKVVLKIGGNTGDGNSRVILDDLYASASPYYAGGVCNSAPVAVDDVFNGINGLPFSGNVLSNDSDPNGELIKSSVVATSPDGTVVMNQDGSFTFTPNVGFIGTVTTFTYQLVDEGFDPATSNTATVTINFSTPIGLPVKLISFTAQLSGTSKVDLKWATSAEINASHFIVERSFDGKEFSEVGMVFAAGNSTTIQQYQYTDNLIGSEKNIIYYRLRQVDADGKADLSATRIIRSGKNSATVTILTYPNPVASELRITVPNNWQGKKVNYEIINVSGQTAKRMVTASSSQTETLDLSTLAPGFYMVKVSCNGDVAQQKIVKQ